MVPELSGSRQHNYTTKTRQACRANAQTIYLSYVYACSTISFLLYDILFAHLAYTQMISFFVSIKSNQKSLSTIELLVLTTLDLQLFYTENITYLLYQASYLNEGVNCVGPSPSVSIPWSS